MTNHKCSVCEKDWNCNWNCNLNYATDGIRCKSCAEKALEK